MPAAAGKQECKLLVTIGPEDASPSSAALKQWNLQAVPGLGGAPPPPVRTVKVFTAKHPADAAVTVLAVHDQEWPALTVALGMSNGRVLVLRGDGEQLVGLVHADVMRWVCKYGGFACTAA